MKTYARGEAPRVTPEDIESNIVAEHYFSGLDGVNGAIAAGTYSGRTTPKDNKADLIPLDLLTFCVLITKNNFVVWGASKPVSIDNFDAVLGRKYARADAVKQLWPVMAYALNEKLAQEG